MIGHQCQPGDKPNQPTHERQDHDNCIQNVELRHHRERIRHSSQQRAKHHRRRPGINKQANAQDQPEYPVHDPTNSQSLPVTTQVARFLFL